MIKCGHECTTSRMITISVVALDSKFFQKNPWFTPCASISNNLHYNESISSQSEFIAVDVLLS
jgi:hypothetical protein